MKSIYSLVLSDEVVAKIDQEAYRMHTSRSNLINQILAEHFSCVTSEMRMQAVFSSMESLIHQFRILEQTSANMLALQSQLNYKYKPTVQYMVQLYKNPEKNYAGVLHIRLRTQNPLLLASLEQFFRMWAHWEKEYLPSETEYRFSPGRMERLIPYLDVDEETFGQRIGNYVGQFDKYLKDWFSDVSPEEMEMHFRQDAAETDLI